MQRSLNSFDSLRSIKKNPVPNAAAVINKEAELPQDCFQHVQLSHKNSLFSTESCLILLNKNQTMPFRGAITLLVVRGSVQSAGFTIQEGQVHELYSSATDSLLSVSCSDETNHSGEYTFSVNENLDSMMNSFQKQIKSNSKAALIYVTSNKTTKSCLRVEEVLPVLANCFGTDSSKDDFQFHGFYPVLKLDKSTSILQIPRSWRDISIKLISLPVPTIICIAGNRNTGKSTFARYLSNRFISIHKEVAFLDCDLGQSELTISGAVSLHHLKSPLLGTNTFNLGCAFTHLRQPLHAAFIGNNTPQQDPDAYLARIFDLLGVYKETLSHLNLVVNTSGWIKGMGYDLLFHFINKLQPNALVQMHHFGEAASSLKNLPSEFVFEDFTVSHALVEAISTDTSTMIRNNKLNAAEQRQLTICSYFMKDLDEWTFDLSLSQVVPYVVGWDRFHIKFMYDEVPFSQSLVALNGMIVALIHLPALKDEAKGEAQLRFIGETASLGPHNLIGAGIIRSIDMDSQTFHIITPVDSSMLSQINCIARGSTELPTCLLTHRNESGDILPYTTFNTEGIGADVGRNRHIQRRPK